MPDILLPFIKKDGEIEDEPEIPLDTLALDIFDLIATSPYQQRKTLRTHPLLMAAAQYKADDMAVRNYFAHVSPIGEASSDYIRAKGYFLPDDYKAGKNYFESISIGGGRPEDNVAGWYGSERHKNHVFGFDKFYREQECIGLGHAFAQDGRHLYVFISCPCMD